MKPKGKQIRFVDSIHELHHLMGLSAPRHPLISVIQLSTVGGFPDVLLQKINYHFYQVCIKRNFKGRLRYGQHYYDFDAGVVSFMSPGQVLSADETATEGCVLIIHPDFLHGYPLAKTIEDYGFFSYAVNEALFLSEEERIVMETIMGNIEKEYRSNIDAHSQQIIIAQVELLLSYAHRFYSRQFITRKKGNNDLLSQLEKLLSDYFNQEAALEKGLPTVAYLAAQLHVSPHYLSDLLRNTTGQSAQQHIQGKLVEKAKEYLSTTNMSIGEIAYKLGFGYPQSFNKFFKKKTSVSPLDFRHSFN